MSACLYHSFEMVAWWCDVFLARANNQNNNNNCRWCDPTRGVMGGRLYVAYSQKSVEDVLESENEDASLSTLLHKHTMDLGHHHLI
jgi:hypothetical protein